MVPYCDLRVAAHQHAGFGVVLGDRAQPRHQIVQFDLGFLDVDAVLRVDRDEQRLVSAGRDGAAVFGRSTGTPTVISGAATMKTISSTSITSTSGVTLISR